MEQTGNIYVVEAEENFKRVHKSIIESENIDCETLGIYTRIIVLGLKWNLNIKGLSAHLKLSDTRIRKAISTLEKEGYIVRTAVKQESGKFAGWNYKVYPYPVNEEQRSAAGKPTSQKTDTPQNGHDRLPTTPFTDMTENREDINNKLKEPIDLNNNKTQAKDEASSCLTEYQRFDNWVKNNAPYCYKNMKAITEAEYEKMNKSYKPKQICFIIEQIENRKDLRKRYTNLYRTVLNWAKKEYGDKGTTKA